MVVGESVDIVLSFLHKPHIPSHGYTTSSLFLVIFFFIELVYVKAEFYKSHMFFNLGENGWLTQSSFQT